MPDELTLEDALPKIRKVYALRSFGAMSFGAMRAGRGLTIPRERSSSPCRSSPARIREVDTAHAMAVIRLRHVRSQRAQKEDVVRLCAVLRALALNSVLESTRSHLRLREKQWKVNVNVGGLSQHTVL